MNFNIPLLGSVLNNSPTITPPVKNLEILFAAPLSDSEDKEESSDLSDSFNFNRQLSILIATQLETNPDLIALALYMAFYDDPAGLEENSMLITPAHEEMTRRLHIGTPIIILLFIFLLIS